MRFYYNMIRMNLINGRQDKISSFIYYPNYFRGEPIDGLFAKSIKKVISNKSLEPGYKAVLLKLPTQDSLTDDLIKLGKTPDPLEIHKALIKTEIGCAKILKDDFVKLFKELQIMTINPLISQIQENETYTQLY